MQGILNRLSERVDIQIKVAERLCALFGREMRLVWDRGNLQVEFARGTTAYPSFREASGLLHMVAILAALYEDELKAVLIDEPELSLHPQYQAFVRREIERVAGDPGAGKKIVIYATHAPAMVRLRLSADLPDVAFFTDPDTPPTQVDPSAGELRNQRLGTFVRSLGAGQREALFAARPLLVEGPNDEIVLDALDAVAGTHLHAAGGHVLPTTGKGSMPTILKLLRLTGKRPAVLADLDAFTDDLGLVQAFNDVDEGRAAALGQGHANIYDAVKPVHDQLNVLATTCWGEIEALAAAHPYWTSTADSVDEPKRRRRAAAAAHRALPRGGRPRRRGARGGPRRLTREPRRRGPGYDTRDIVDEHAPERSPTRGVKRW